MRLDPGRGRRLPGRNRERPDRGDVAQQVAPGAGARGGGRAACVSYGDEAGQVGRGHGHHQILLGLSPCSMVPLARSVERATVLVWCGVYFLRATRSSSVAITEFARAQAQDLRAERALNQRVEADARRSGDDARGLVEIVGQADAEGGHLRSPVVVVGQGDAGRQARTLTDPAPGAPAEARAPARAEDLA